MDRRNLSPARSALAGLALAACGPTVAQERMTTIQGELVRAVSEQSSCRSAVFAKPEYAEFSARLPRSAASPEPSQLTDAAKVRPAQRAAAASFFRELADCRRGFILVAARAVPPMQPVMFETEAAYEANRARLVAGDISWGESNARAMTIASDFRVRAQQTIDAVRAELAASHAAEMEGRMAAAQILGAALGAAAGAAATTPYYSRPVVVNRYYFIRR